ncbi:MAG: hypothetical protein C0402_04755 [Thermodesulfovibrio sp.]|nr:hypothetical protein [Thermodesulfovibrio sp.]
MIEIEEKTAKYVLCLLFIACLVIGVAEYYYNLDFAVDQKDFTQEKTAQTVITGFVRSGENLVNIFKKHKLRLKESLMVSEASANVHKLSSLGSFKPYKIVVGPDRKLESFTYGIDDDSVVTVINTDSGYRAEKKVIAYEKRILSVGGVIRNNLIDSIGEDREHLLLGLDLSDILAWDIDFSTGLRSGDSFRIVVEGLYLDNEFRKFGKILSAQFINNGSLYAAYRFEQNGDAHYYDETGRSLRKAFLKAPLNFRKISSHYSGSRLHPILKIYRPHHGIDYSAPAGTPVSASGGGTVSFAGYKNGYGKLVILSHPNGYRTCYGHLSKFGEGISSGKKVEQGQVVGYVGSTGMSTGPHLHYEMLVNNKTMNPLKIKMPAGEAIPKTLLADFSSYRKTMDTRLALIGLPIVASGERSDR